MFLKLDEKHLEEYRKNDYLLPIIKEQADNIPLRVAICRQYRNMVKLRWKRALFHYFYGDIKNKKILDIAGGYCGVPSLINDNDYTLLDRCDFFDKLDIKGKIVVSTYENFDPTEKYDIITCCDLFLTDNRKLWTFIDKFLPHCGELRICLTFRYFAYEKDIEKFNGWTLNELNELFHHYCIEQGRNLEFNNMTYEKIKELSGWRNIYIISLKGGE
jgi:hypothetical protein